MFYFFLRYSVVGVAFVFAAILLWLPLMSSAQNKFRTDTISISGLTEDSKPVIEKAIGTNSDVRLVWSDGQAKATLIFDAKKHSRSELLKEIALAGFDNSDYLAPDEAYQNLPAALRYYRVRKVKWNTLTNPLIKTPQVATIAGVSNTKKVTPLSNVISSYLLLKDALVITDSKATAVAAAKMFSNIKMIKPNDIPATISKDWTAYHQQLEPILRNLSKETNIDIQRQLFMALSPAMYSITKANGYQEVLYYQFCPMANNGKGANWISQLSEIKNPYYGSMMLNCGQTVETIK